MLQPREACKKALNGRKRAILEGCKNSSEAEKSRERKRMVREEENGEREDWAETSL